MVHHYLTLQFQSSSSWKRLSYIYSFDNWLSSSENRGVSSANWEILISLSKMDLPREHHISHVQMPEIAQGLCKARVGGR